MTASPRPPAPTGTTIDTTSPQVPSDPGAAAKLPHERDQSVPMTDHQPTPAMQQAHRDVRRGLVDTDARGPDGTPLGEDVPAG